MKIMPPAKFYNVLSVGNIPVKAGAELFGEHGPVPGFPVIPVAL
jgi:hypothetical protein